MSTLEVLPLLLPSSGARLLPLAMLWFPQCALPSLGIPVMLFYDKVYSWEWRCTPSSTLEVSSKRITCMSRIPEGLWDTLLASFLHGVRTSYGVVPTRTTSEEMPNPPANYCGTTGTTLVSPSWGMMLCELLPRFSPIIIDMEKCKMSTLQLFL